MISIKNIWVTGAIGILAVAIAGCSGRKDNDRSMSGEKKELVVHEIKYDGLVDLNMAEKLLQDQAEVHAVARINWPEYSYKPDVTFRIAYWRDQIWIKYYVDEENIRAMVTKVNGAVHNDSCVEFFISPAGNNTYYNFEFNCIGVPHVGYTRAGTKNILVNPDSLKKMQIRSSLGDQPFEEKTGGHHWEMMIIIPKSCFAFNKDLNFKGLQATANFYKCGDKTSKPHFVTWNPVGTKKPDYHQPAYFGKIIFN